MNPESQKRDALEEHWQASERRDDTVEQAIYRADAILDYPRQVNDSGAVARFRRNERTPRQSTLHRFRIVGGEDLRVSECVMTYDGVPTYSVSIMGFASGYTAHETQYFANAFGAPEG